MIYDNMYDIAMYVYNTQLYKSSYIILDYLINHLIYINNNNDDQYDDIFTLDSLYHFNSNIYFIYHNNIINNNNDKYAKLLINSYIYISKYYDKTGDLNLSLDYLQFAYNLYYMYTYEYNFDISTSVNIYTEDFRIGMYIFISHI
jgi:hypothetical protein